jgi:hypothetical protein
VASGIREIRERISELISLATPDVDPAITYRPVDGGRSIEELEPKGSPSQTTRGYQVWSEPITGEGFLGGCSVDQHQRVRVIMRYYYADGRNDAWLDLRDRWAADTARIEEALLRPPVPDSYAGTPLIDIRLETATQLYQTTIEHVWFGLIDFRVLYRLDQDTYGGEFTPNFTTLTALHAWLATKNKGAAARLVNARTRELIGVWVNGSVEASWVDFSKADGLEFADGVDLIRQPGASYTITYGTGIVVTGAAVEFYGFALDDNTDILPIGTTADYVRLPLRSYTSLVDLEATAGELHEVRRTVDSAGVRIENYEYDGATWVALSGGGGLVSEYATLSALFASVGASGDYALLLDGASGPAGIARHDGTRWLLMDVDLARVGVQGATILDALIVRNDAGCPFTWTAAGLQLKPTVTAYDNGVYWAPFSSPVGCSETGHVSIMVDCEWDSFPPGFGSDTLVGLYTDQGAGPQSQYVGGTQFAGGPVTSERPLLGYGAVGALSYSTGSVAAINTAARVVHCVLSAGPFGGVYGGTAGIPAADQISTTFKVTTAPSWDSTRQISELIIQPRSTDLARHLTVTRLRVQL